MYGHLNGVNTNMKRHLSRGFLILLLSLSGQYLDATDFCPKDCQCTVDRHTRLYDVSCWGPTVPTSFPPMAASILIRRANQSVIPPDTFNNLTHLKNLTISGSIIKSLLNSSFTGLDKLQHISLNDCNLRHIDPDVFKPLANIRDIDLTNNHYVGFPAVFNALKRLKNIYLLQSLNLKYTNDRTQTSVLKLSFLDSLRMTGLKFLCLSSNEIAIIETGVTEYIPSVERLILSNNIIVGEQKSFYEIFTLEHLRFLDLSNQGIYSEKFEHKPLSDSPKMLKISDNPGPCLPYPPKLESINFHRMGSLTINSSPWVICRNNSLKYYDLSMIHAYIMNYISGLEVVEYLSFMHNKCYFIYSLDFFANFPRLKTLLLGGNKLTLYFENDINGTLFDRNKWLRTLDISYNRVKHLPSMFLKSLRNLTIFNVSGNFVNDINDFYLFKSASGINLSNNAIEDMPLSIMNAFNLIGKNLTLDISKNPLTTKMACCSIRTFISWVIKTNVNLAQSDSYICVHNNELVHLASLPLSFINDQCPTIHDKLFSIVISVLVTFGVAVGVISLCYRKRLTLLWWIIQMKRYTRLEADSQIDDDVIYDAFICYSGDDILWVRNNMETELEAKRGYRLCIHERDFVPGNPIDENIVTAIQQSRRTVLLLTKNFQESEWCDFEVKMAHRHSHYKEQSTIIPIVFSSFDVSKASLLLRSILGENSYINWNSNKNHKRMFWDVFTKALGTPLDRIA